MTLFAIPLVLLLALGLGVVVARRAGWGAGLGAALVALLISGGLYVGFVMLIVSSMD